VRVHDIRLEDDRTRFELSGRVTMDRLDTNGLRIWFRGPIKYANGELDASPFLPGLLATAIQHEMDHLNGKLIIDFLSRLKRDIIVRRFKKLAKETA